MNTKDNRVTIRVWGDYACFTRPEMKVERVSYPIWYPSGARGILEAIYWEPQMYYIVDSIDVVKKGRWFSFRRNEVTSVININQAQSWMQGKTPPKYIMAGGGAPDAAQRNMLALAGVEYLITAEVRTTRLHNSAAYNLEKYLREIQSRSAKGKCCYRPALGCREFDADFDWVEDVTKIKLAKWDEEDLGLMLYDLFDVDQREEGFRWLSEEELKLIGSGNETKLERRPNENRKALSGESKPLYAGKVIQPQASFFQAKVKDAHMDCHPDRIKILRPRGKEVN